MQEHGCLAIGQAPDKVFAIKFCVGIALVLPAFRGVVVPFLFR